MKFDYLSYLCCPVCRSDLVLDEDIVQDKRVKEGQLTCHSCSVNYPITNYVPRFVDTQDYADSFGSQWNAFAKSQLDDQQTSESTLRFDSEVGWDAGSLADKSIIEIGSGAGRFIDVISKRGVKLAIGVDLTSAVDASQNNLGERDNVLFVQADAFNLPIKDSSVDFAYSIGVLHHTPDPQLAFESMVNTVKNSGNVAVSVYEISLYSRPNRNTLKVVTMELLWAVNMWRCELFRSFTTKIPDGLMIAYCKSFVPILHYLNKVPILGLIRYLFPSTCYRNLPVVWSMVDTMDTYSTKIVHQYRAKDVFQWFLKLGLTDVILMNGRAGWVSLTANKGDLKTRAKNTLILDKPKTIGNIGD
ncbi:methyltransferase domain-containing protein [bacterium]|nr:methyltransferase domain-containing protein [bacterium]